MRIERQLQFNNANHILVTTSTTPTTTTDTLYHLFILKLRFRHPADARCIEVGLFSLNAAETTKLK